MLPLSETPNIEVTYKLDGKCIRDAVLLALLDVRLMLPLCYLFRQQVTS